MWGVYPVLRGPGSRSMNGHLAAVRDGLKNDGYDSFLCVFIVSKTIDIILVKKIDVKYQIVGRRTF